MLNEATDNSEKVNYELIKIRLCNKYNIFLILYFEQTAKKRYLIVEKIILDEYEILDQVELLNLKIFFKKFVTNSLNIMHENIYVEQVQKKLEGRNTFRTLKIKDKTIYLTDLDIEVIIERWKEALFGFSKVKLYSNEKIFTANKYSIKFNNSQFIENPNIHTTSLTNPNEEFEKTINESVLIGKITKEEINLELEKIKQN